MFSFRHLTQFSTDFAKYCWHCDSWINASSFRLKQIWENLKRNNIPITSVVQETPLPLIVLVHHFVMLSMIDAAPVVVLCVMLMQINSISILVMMALVVNQLHSFNWSQCTQRTCCCRRSIFIHKCLREPHFQCILSHFVNTVNHCFW